MELIFIAVNAVAAIIRIGAFVIAGLLLLRVLLTWVGANPFGRLSYHLTGITEPLVRPLRRQFGGRYLRFDLLPLVVAVMILFVGLFISSTISQFALILSRLMIAARTGTLTVGLLVGNLIYVAGTLYLIAIFLRVFLPFFGVGHKSATFRFVFQITEPLLKPLRRFLIVGMFDLSPFVAMILVHLLTGILAGMFV